MRYHMEAECCEGRNETGATVSWRLELMVGDAITELFSLIAMKMIRF